MYWVNFKIFLDVCAINNEWGILEIPKNWLDIITDVMGNKIIDRFKWTGFISLFMWAHIF